MTGDDTTQSNPPWSVLSSRELVAYRSCGCVLMLGPTHRCFAALFGAATATAVGQPSTMVAMTAIVATATSNGWSSPDVDQTKPWRTFAEVMPPPLRPLMGHRRLSHWWGLPLIAFFELHLLPAEAQWPAIALLIGWVSHLVGDAIFGALPLMPYGGPHFGLQLSTGGLLETGRLRVLGANRTVLPFGPTRLLIVATLLWVLLDRRDLHAAAQHTMAALSVM